MIDIFLILLALIAAGAAFTFYLANKAPVGYQDDQGFHYGKQSKIVSKDATKPIIPLVKCDSTIRKKHAKGSPSGKQLPVNTHNQATLKRDL